MKRALFHTVIVSAFFLTTIAAGTAITAKPTPAQAKYALVFMGHKGLKPDDPRGIYAASIADKKIKPKLIASGGTSNFHIISTCQGKCALITSPDKLYAYRFPEEDEIELTVPTTLRHDVAQQLDDDTVVISSQGRPQAGQKIHVLTLHPFRFQSKEYLPSNKAQIQRWEWMGGAKASPDLKHVAFFVQPKTRSRSPREPNAPKPTISLMVSEIGTGKVRELVSGIWPGWVSLLANVPYPSLEWRDNSHVIYFHTMPDSLGYKTENKPFIMTVDIETGRATTATSEEEKRLRGSDADRFPMDVSLRYKFVPQPNGPAVFRDMKTGKDILKAWVSYEYCPTSRDGSIIAFIAPSKQGSKRQDLYIFNSNTGKVPKIFSGYGIGNLYWLGN